MPHDIQSAQVRAHNPTERLALNLPDVPASRPTACGCRGCPSVVPLNHPIEPELPRPGPKYSTILHDRTILRESPATGRNLWGKPPETVISHSLKHKCVQRWQRGPTRHQLVLRRVVRLGRTSRRCLSLSAVGPRQPTLHSFYTHRTWQPTGDRTQSRQKFGHPVNRVGLGQQAHRPANGSTHRLGIWNTSPPSIVDIARRMSISIPSFKKTTRLSPIRKFEPPG